MVTSIAPAADSRLFRQHTRTVHLNTALLQQLCQEWTELHLSPTSRATILGWHETHPTLAGLDSPGAITDHIDAGDHATKDLVMLALLEMFHAGDQLAGRILLQAMLPGLTHLARRTRTPRGSDADETLQRTLTEFWYVITTRAALPPHGVAGRLQLDTLHRLTSCQRREADMLWDEHTSAIADVVDQEDRGSERRASRRADQRDLSSGTVDRCGTRPLNTEDSPIVGCGDFDTDAGLLEFLLHARDTAVITAGDAQFLAEVYVLSDNMAAAARRLGKNPAAVRQRCCRLRQRLIAAVIADREATAAAQLIA